jgi:hypothetical protein
VVLAAGLDMQQGCKNNPCLFRFCSYIAGNYTHMIDKLGDQLKLYELDVIKTKERIKALKNVKQSDAVRKHANAQFRLWVTLEIQKEEDVLEDNVQSLHNLRQLICQERGLVNDDSPFVLVCDCSSREHQIIIQHDNDDNLTYCHIHLVKHGFWRRVEAGLKYIFGYKCRYGEWDEFIFKPEHAKQLRELSDLLIRKK